MNSASARTPAPLSAGRPIIARTVAALLREGLVDATAAAARGIEIPVRRADATGGLALTGPVRIDGYAITDPGVLLDTLAARDLLPPTDPERFARTRAELVDSAAGLARADAGLARRWAPRLVATTRTGSGFEDLLALLDGQRPPQRRRPAWLLSRFEQLVGEGHHLHPGAKTALGLPDESASQVLPEQVEEIELPVFAVSRDRIEEYPGSAPWSEALAAAAPEAVRQATAELSAAGLDPADWVLVPAHPFQAEQVLPRVHAEMLASGALRPTGAQIPAEPLLGVRTLATHGGDGSHLKTALEVQLTGAIRGISAHVAGNAPQLAAGVCEALALDAAIVGRTCDDLPAFDFIPETCAIHLPVPGDAAAARSLGAILRADPTADCAPADIALPVAALFARSPRSRRTVLAELIDHLPPGSTEAWFDRLLDLLLPSCLGLLTRWGIALEPHQQNTVLVLRDGIPHRLLVRDAGGVRLLPDRAARRGLSLHPVPGSPLVAEDAAALRAKLFFPLFGNLLTQLVGELAALGEGDDRRWWDRVATAADRVFRDLAALGFDEQEAADLRDDARALFEEPWRYKTMLRMRLTGAVTEQAYRPADNPLRTHPRDPDLMAPDQELATAIAAERATATMDTRRALCAAAVREELTVEPENWLPTLTGTETGRRLLSESEESAQNLALARAQVRRRIDGLAAQARLHGSTGLLATLLRLQPPSLAGVAVDSLAAEGHNVHPNAKVRSGFTAADSLAFAPDAGRVVDLRLAAVPRELLSGSTVHDELRRHFPRLIDHAERECRQLGLDPAEVLFLPLHPWQARQVLPGIDAQVGHRIRLLSTVTLACLATVSMRTLLTRAPGVRGHRLLIKVALDVLLTSTRRSISATTALAAPATADLVDRLTGDRAAVIREIAGCCLAVEEVDSTAARGLSALIREDPAAVLGGDRLAISTCALRAPGLTAATLLDELVAEQPAASDRDRRRHWLNSHGRALLAATLPLLWVNGIALEAHLQNSMVIIDTDRPGAHRGILLRDFAGLRIDPQLLNASGQSLPLLAGTPLQADPATVRAKSSYALIWAHLDALVTWLADSPQERATLWHLVGDIAAELMERHEVVPEDAAALVGPRSRLKAFTRMRLEPDRGDLYVEVANPLARSTTR